MAELRSAAPGRWLLDLDQTDRDFLLAGLDFARTYLRSVGKRAPGGQYKLGASWYQMRLDPIEQALAFPSTRPLADSPDANHEPGA